MAIYASNQWRITLNVANVTLDTVSWDKASGGEITADNQTYNPGGMAPQVVAGGLRKRGPITVERVWSDSLIKKFVALDGAAGIQKATVSLTPLHADRSVVTTPITYTGVVESVTRPQSDSSSSTLETMTVVITLNESISGGA